MTTSIERYHAAHSQFERDWILNDMPIAEFTMLVYEVEEKIKAYKGDHKPIFSFADMRLLQREYGVDVREKEFELRVEGCIFKVRYDGGFGTYVILACIPNQQSFMWEV